MRLCFVIACMAVIGVGLVHLRKRESIARHELLQLEKGRLPLRRTAMQLESELGFLTTPKQVSQRARKLDIEADHNPVRLAGPTGRGSAPGNRGVAN